MSSEEIAPWTEQREGPSQVSSLRSVVPPEKLLIPAPMDWEDLLEQAPEAREERWVPRFEVRAVGSFVQQPGCPSGTAERASGLSRERLERPCRRECYHPSDERIPIRTIEIVRVLPQLAPDEPVADLIEDPWRQLDCVGDKDGCVVRSGRSTS